MTNIFVPKELEYGESRVALTPLAVKRCLQEGFTVTVELGAGLGTFISDAEYQEVGAVVVDAARGFQGGELILAVNPPRVEQAKMLQLGASLISFVFPHQNDELIRVCVERKSTVFAMEAIPRITRAQKYDALSSQANLAGYQAVLLAAVECPKIFPLMMTAAGTLRPARVVVMGAGVAGLQAVATARRLGAIVEVSDIRPAVKEQIQSLGASYIEVPTDESMETAGGYAREVTPEFLLKQADITRAHLTKADVVITSALVPGKKAPVLISEDVVKEMRRGCVIIDMAADQGGNCALTEPRKTTVKHGVKIIGAPNLAAQVPVHASEAYARNIINIILDQPHAGGDFRWNIEDEVVVKSLVLREGERCNQK